MGLFSKKENQPRYCLLCGRGNTAFDKVFDAIWDNTIGKI